MVADIVTIGAVETNDIPLDGEDVSRYHAALIRRPSSGEYFIRDLKNKKIRNIRKLIKDIASSEVLVNTLILGETGTGKELVARAIHENRPRKDKPFEAINCANLPENLAESELFGHEPGAFTDARHQRKGNLEIAKGGTVFLDEIGDLPLPIQGRLLRFLQEGTFTRTGGSEKINPDV